MMDRQTITLLPSASRTASGNSGTQKNSWARGVRLVVDVTAASGTSPTLDVKVQYWDAASAQWVDVDKASIGQFTGAGTDDLIIYPGIEEKANRGVSTVLPGEWRVAYTIGGTSPDITFSVGAELLQ